MKVQHCFPIGLTDLVSLLFKGLSRVFSSIIILKYQFFSAHSAFFMVQLSHPYMTTGKTIALTIEKFVGKEVSLLFNTLFRSKEQASSNFTAAVTIYRFWSPRK